MSDFTINTITKQNDELYIVSYSRNNTKSISKPRPHENLDMEFLFAAVEFAYKLQNAVISQATHLEIK
jgi:hypothetical protein